MTQKTIKALYKQPVNYKLIRDGYKTTNGVIQAQDGMPKVVDLSVPSELYITDLQYNVDTEANGAPIIITESFTLPDNEICEAKQYCYAPKGTDYNYTRKQVINYKVVDETTFTKSGSITINSDGVATNFNGNYLVVNKAISNVNSYEVVIKFKTTSFNNGRLIGTYQNNQHSIQVEVPDSSENKLWWGHPSSSYSWQAFNPNYIIETNKWYWVKGIYDSTTSKVTVYMHDENDDYINCGELSVSGCGWDDGIDIGYDGGWGDGLSQNSCIDLFESYIKINGIYWWKPWEDKSRIDVITTQIPGILDSSVTTDNWHQNQGYKLYQLKNQNNTDSLQLTENSITDTAQKYKQYISQLTIPARDYKWYYNGIPEESYPTYYAEGEVVISNGVASNFGEGSLVEFNVYPHYYEEPVESFTTVIEFETGDSVTDHSLLELLNRHYNPTLDRYTEEMIYFSCIHNGKFSTTDDGTLTNFNDGTTLSPNTKYWMALYLTDESATTYLISDNNYTQETLPSLSSWTLENTITFSETMDIFHNEWFFGCHMDWSGEGGEYDPFNGRLFVDNMLAFNGLTLDSNNIIWEPYNYYDYVYRWYANKSLYNYTENESYADILNFSDSWVNVTDNWKTQKKYVSPEVLLMPTQVNGYLITREISEVLYTDLSTLPSTLLDNNNFIMSGTALASGPTSYNIDGAKSFGYFTYTPTKNETITIKAYVSSEGNYDYGACYIGTQLYNASRDQITSQVTDGNGSWLFLISGSTSETTYTKDLLEGVTYYIHFYYTKDGSSSSGNDRVFITSLSGFSKKENVSIPLPGCLYNYNDDGSEHSFDVYYNSNYTQPILVSAGESYSEGTKVDTITIPAHRTWDYQTGGNWSPISYVDISYSDYTYDDGNLVLTKYTGSDTDVTVPNAVI